MGNGRAYAERLAAKGDQKRAKEIRQKLAAGKRRLETLRTQLEKAKSKQEEETVEAIAFDSPAQMVTEAYLRTLSREPTEKEMTISLAHMQSADEPVDGLHDLMWALLNTKEFIVNH